MIFMNYYFVILWAVVGQISAPTSPSTGQEMVPSADQNMLRGSQKLHIYLQIIKNIDMEQSMESVVELMNMLRLLFPVRFFRIKKKMFDMYDPSTHRSFGVAFQALMNMLRDKTKRDKLHTIFQELMVPHSADDPKFPDNADVQQSDMGLPLKYKSATTRQNTAPTAKAVEILRPAPTQNPDEQFREPILDNSGNDTDYEANFTEAEGSQIAGRLNPAAVNESQPSRSSSMRIQQRQTSANLAEPTAQSQLTRRNPQYSVPDGNPVERPVAPSASNQETEVTKPNPYLEKLQKLSATRPESEGMSERPQLRVSQTNGDTSVAPDEISEAKRRETELRLVRMKSFLDRVKNNGAAPASLQAKAAMISQILANERGAAVGGNGNLKIPKTASRRIEAE